MSKTTDFFYVNETFDSIIQKGANIHNIHCFPHNHHYLLYKLKLSHYCLQFQVTGEFISRIISDLAIKICKQIKKTHGIKMNVYLMPDTAQSHGKRTW